MKRISHSVGYLLCALAIAASALTGSASAEANDSQKNIRIIYSNDTLGYLKSCGCGRDDGGMARRATLIAQLVKENPQCVIVDSGNVSNVPGNLDIMTSLMSSLKYDAIGIGSIDWGMKDEFLKAVLVNKLTLLDATSDSGTSALPYLIKKLDGVTVGIVSYGSNEVAATEEQFLKAYKEARDNADLIIMLDQGGIAKKEWLESIASTIGAPDIVIPSIARKPLDQEEIVGKTHIMPRSTQGKAIGIIDVEIAKGQPFKLSSRMLPILKDTAEDETVQKQVTDFLLRPLLIAKFSPSNLNLGNIKKGTQKETYVTLTPTGADKLSIVKSFSSGVQVSAPDWTLAEDGRSYRIKIVVKAGKTPGRIMETVSVKLDFPDEPILKLLVFGNIVDE